MGKWDEKTTDMVSPTALNGFLCPTPWADFADRRPTTGGLRRRDLVLEEEQERVAWLQTKCRSGSTASCNAKRAGSTYRVQGEACGLNLPATADVSSAMGLTRRLAAEVVLAGLVYRRRERGKRRQSP